MRLHCWYLLGLFFSSSVAVAAPPTMGRPALYSYFTDAGSEEERILQATYGARYTIVSPAKTSGLTPAKVVQETYPLYGQVPGGAGKTAVAFIVMPSGRVKDPVVVYSTQPRNDRMVREMVSKWIYQPAKLNGVPVPSIASYYAGFSRLETRSIGYSRPPKEKK